MDLAELPCDSICSDICRPYRYYAARHAVLTHGTYPGRTWPAGKLGVLFFTPDPKSSAINVDGNAPQFRGIYADRALPKRRALYPRAGIRRAGNVDIL